MCSHESRKKCGSTWVSQSHSSSEGFSDNTTLRYIYIYIHIHSKHRYAAKSQLDSRCLYIHECKSPCYGEAKVDWRKLAFLTYKKCQMQHHSDESPLCRGLDLEVYFATGTWVAKDGPGGQENKMKNVSRLVELQHVFFCGWQSRVISFRTPQDALAKVVVRKGLHFEVQSAVIGHFIGRFQTFCKSQGALETVYETPRRNGNPLGVATTPGAQWSWTLWGPRAADVHLAAWSEWRSGAAGRQVGMSGCWVDPGDDMNFSWEKINKTSVKYMVLFKEFFVLAA